MKGYGTTLIDQLLVKISDNNIHFQLPMYFSTPQNLEESNQLIYKLSYSVLVLCNSGIMLFRLINIIIKLTLEF